MNKYAITINYQDAFSNQPQTKLIAVWARSFKDAEKRIKKRYPHLFTSNSATIDIKDEPATTTTTYSFSLNVKRLMDYIIIACIIILVIDLIRGLI